MTANPELDQYIECLLPPRDAVLQETEAYAAEHRVPIVGPAVATRLAQCVLISGAKRIFELGSATPRAIQGMRNEPSTISVVPGWPTGFGFLSEMP